VPHRRSFVAAAGIAAAAAAVLVASTLASSAANPPKPQKDRSNQTASPIKHLVVLFDENVSYDHYFGTYPKAKNVDGTTFYAASSTPRNDNLITSDNLTSNPNQYYPTRLTPSEAMTCDQNHSYGPEQKAENSGAMDAFVQNVSVDTCSGEFGAPGLSMDYYDGNTVTGLWNYAQQYAMSDNSWDTTFGPSTPGALNLVSGQTHGFREVDSVTGKQVPTPGSYVLVAPDKNGVGTVINDPDPAYDDCSDANHTSTNTLAAATGQNIGDLLNERGVSWGWFQGGFAPTATATETSYAVCGAKHTNIGGASVVDYSPHHNPFEYYQSTSNPHHVAPADLAEVGHNGAANHEYDLSWFDKAVKKNSLPAVSFVKAAEYQDGHAGYSDPIDEQHFLVDEINLLQKSPEWKSTAVIVAYDDSDGWYDHDFIAPKNGSSTSQDTTMCSSQAHVTAGYQGRCGPGPRLPLLVISPYAKTNFVDHQETEQASITKFIETNWFTGRIGDGSFDQRAGSLNHLFDFTQSNNKRVLLKQNGSVKSIRPIRGGHAMAATRVITK
jgi:phospholipase C